VPFDGCTVSGMYGRTWNDTHGTHYALEAKQAERFSKYEKLGLDPGQSRRRLTANERL